MVTDIIWCISYLGLAIKSAVIAANPTEYGVLLDDAGFQAYYAIISVK